MNDFLNPPKPTLSQGIQQECGYCLRKFPESLHDAHKSKCIHKYYNMIGIFWIFFSIFGGLAAIALIPS